MIEDKSAERLINRMPPSQAQVVKLTVSDETSGEIAQTVAVEVTGLAPEVAAPAAPETETSAAAPAAEASKNV